MPMPLSTAARSCPFLELDWNRPGLADTFDYIVASEVTYKKEHVGSLVKLFRTYLKPDGAVYLAGEMRRVSREFLSPVGIRF